MHVYANAEADSEDVSLVALIETLFADKSDDDYEQDAVTEPALPPETDADRHPDPAAEEDVDEDDARSARGLSNPKTDDDEEQPVAASPRAQYDRTPRAEHGHDVQASLPDHSLPDHDDHDENPDAMHMPVFLLSPVFPRPSSSQRVPIARQPATTLQLHPDPGDPAGTGDLPAFQLAGAPLLAGAGGGTDDAHMHTGTGADAGSVDDLPEGDIDGAPADQGPAPRPRGRKRKEVGQVGSLQEAVARLRQLQGKNQAAAALKFAGIAPGKNGGTAYFDKLDQACRNPAQAARLAEYFKVPVPAAE